MRKKIKNFILAVIPLLVFFALWELGSHYAPRGVLSPPSKVIIATLKAFADPKEQLLFHTLESFKRIGLGFLLAAVVGNIFGFLLGTFFRPLESLFIPFFKVCEKINPFAVIPIFMILFGIGTEEKVAVVFWACIWPILTITQETAKSVDQRLVKAARTMGAGRLKIFFSVIFPFTLPSIFTGLKMAIRVAFFMIIAAETIGASSGLGWYFTRKQALYNLNLVYGSILYITVLAIAFNYIFTRIEKRFLVWKQEAYQ